jgi:hypothetical protein
LRHHDDNGVKQDHASRCRRKKHRGGESLQLVPLYRV